MPNINGLTHMQLRKFEELLIMANDEQVVKVIIEKAVSHAIARGIDKEVIMATINRCEIKLQKK